jgi:hypothetical protein
MAGAASRLTVGRLSIEARIPRDQPIPPGIGIRLEAMARDQLQPSLADALAPVCPEGDPAVWVIRRLDLELLVDAGWNRDRMARRWAREFAQSLTRILHGPLDGNVLRFPDRASYLAQFLRDLAGDRAWGRWYYGPFRDLASLPRSAAIREALAREPAMAEPALLALAVQYGTRELRQALTGADAGKILEMIRGAEPAAAPTAESIEAAIEAWPEILLGTAGEARSKAALVLQLALRLSRPALPRPVVTAAVDALLHLVASLREISDPDAWLDSVLAEPAEPETPARIATSTALKKAESRARLIELARTAPAQAVNLRPEGQRLPTAFAGLFLLWRSVVALGFESFFAGDATRRSLLAAKLMGMAALADPAVQPLTGAEKPRTTPIWPGSCARRRRGTSGPACLRPPRRANACAWRRSPGRMAVVCCCCAMPPATTGSGAGSCRRTGPPRAQPKASPSSLPGIPDWRRHPRDAISSASGPSCRIWRISLCRRWKVNRSRRPRSCPGR